MAKVSAHGTEIGTIDRLTYRIRFMSDKTILINRGGGWKIHARNVANIADVFADRKQKQIARERLRPAYAAYKRELHALAPIATRWKLNAAVELMPDDCDGVWSECCDGYGENVHADVDEVAELCRLYSAAIVEKKAVTP